VTVSIGHASSRSLPDARPETLLANSDAALYEAKALGRNRVCDENSGQAATCPESLCRVET
jgi:PleD family two-component response regulator